MSEDTRRMAELEAKKRAAKTGIPKPVVDLNKQLADIRANINVVQEGLKEAGVSKTKISEAQNKINQIKKSLESKNQTVESINRAKKRIRDIQVDIKKADPSTDGIKPKIVIDQREREIRRKSGLILGASPDVKPLADVANILYKEANFKSQDELKSDIKKYGSISAAKARNLPTTREAVARMGLSLLEPIIGGIDEQTMFLLNEDLTTNRPDTKALRIIGAVATPTAADMVASYALAKLGVTKIGKRILKKMQKALESGDDYFKALTKAELEEARAWESLYGDGLTTLRRNVNKNKNTLKTIEEISDYYKANPQDFTAGASVIPEEVIIFENLANEFDIDSGDLVNFIEDNPNLFYDGTLLTALLSNMSKKDAQKVIEETTNLPSDLIPEIIDSIEEQRSDVPDIIEIQELQERGEVVTGGLSLREDQEIEEIVEDPTKPRPPIQKIDELIITDEAPTDEPIDEDEPVTDEPIPATPFELKSKERQDINLRLFQGKKQKYRVQLKYSDGSKATRTFDARSHPDAIAKGEMVQNRSKMLKTIESERVQ